MLKKISFIGVCTGVFAFVAISQSVSAAPQSLALLSTQGAVPLQCDGGTCAATFSSYCLQHDRSAPAYGTSYQLADTGGLEITGVNREGRRVSFDAKGELAFTAERTQVAVRISLPQSRLQELNLSEVTVTVGENVTLLPAPWEGDDSPLSESEIALATGSLRHAGSRIVDNDEVRAGAIRWLAGLANDLPAERYREARVWRDKVRHHTGKPLQELSPGARHLAVDALEGCKKDLDLLIYKSIRRCVESAHDAHLWNLNADYWQAVRSGS
jgi:hypothetical protein